MVLCVKCCDSIARAKAEGAGWRKVDGAWHCPKDLVGEKRKDDASKKKRKDDASKKKGKGAGA